MTRPVALLVASVLLFAARPLCAQTDAKPPETMLLTVFLRHDQTKTLDEINAHLEKTGFRKNFPPEGVEIVDYHIVMGIGQVLTLRLPPSKLRELNVLFEKSAWGAFKTEFYPTYDYLPVFQQQKRDDAGQGK